MGNVETKAVLAEPMDESKIATVLAAFPFTKEGAQMFVENLDPVRVPEVSVRLKSLTDFLKVVLSEAEAKMLLSGLKEWTDPWERIEYEFKGALGDPIIDDADALAEELEAALVSDDFTEAQARIAVAECLPLVRKPSFESLAKLTRRQDDMPVYPNAHAAIRARLSRKKSGPPHLAPKKK